MSSRLKNVCLFPKPKRIARCPKPEYAFLARDRRGRGRHDNGSRQLSHLLLQLSGVLEVLFLLLIMYVAAGASGVGLLHYFVCGSRANSVAMSMLILSLGKVDVVCGRIGFLFARPPHADHDYGSYQTRDS